MKTEFIIGLINGMAAPFTAISPEPLATRVPEELERSSYIPPSEDIKNIAGDFAKVIERVRPEITAAEKKSPTDAVTQVMMVQPPVATAKIATRHKSFEGPLPHPEILKRYDEIVPGLAERIVAMAEKEQDARLSIAKEETDQKSQLEKSQRPLVRTAPTL